MEAALITASIGIVCITAFIFFSISEKQKKKSVLIGLVTKSLLELNQNKEVLKVILTVLKPKEVSTAPKPFIENQVERKPLPIALEPPIFKHEETEQLKANNEFLIFADINLSVELNNAILRVKYLNQLFPELNNVTALSTDDFKTTYHTHEMIEKLVKELEITLKKLKQ